MRRTSWARALRRSMATMAGAALVWLFPSDSGLAERALAAGPSRIPDARVAAMQAVTECGVLRPEAEASACYERAFLRRLESVGVRDALATLSGAAEEDSDVARDGHVYAHGIGIAAYRRVPNVSASFPQCSTAFASGCYHGVIQAHLDRLANVDREALLALCAPYRGDSATRWLLFQCLHGAGHGLTMHYGHDLPRALESCALLHDPWERDSCYGGAFMENILHATAPHHPATRLAARHHAGGFRPLDPGDPLYPCTVMAKPYLRSCYLLQTSAMLHFNGGSIAGAAQQCDQAPPEMRPACYESLGRDVSAYARQDPGQAIQLCSLGTPEHRPSCYFGAAKSLVDWAATTEPGFQMCRMLAGSRGKESCYLAVGEQVAALYADTARREAECAAAESAKLLQSCRRGARLQR